MWRGGGGGGVTRVWGPPGAVRSAGCWVPGGGRGLPSAPCRPPPADPRPPAGGPPPPTAAPRPPPPPPPPPPPRRPPPPHYRSASVPVSVPASVPVPVSVSASPPASLPRRWDACARTLRQREPVCSTRVSHCRRT